MEIDYIERHIIFETVVGSRAYGTHHEKSDWDRRGVMITGLRYDVGFENVQEFRDYPNQDKVVYGLKKAMMLIADNNPNMLDLLWMPEKCIRKITKYWNKVIAKKYELLSQRCRATYSGYAFMQLNRIRTHRSYLLNPPKEPPNRVDFGLPEFTIFKTAQLKSICSTVLELIPEERKGQFCTELDGIYSDYVLPLLDRYLLPKERILGQKLLQSSIKSQIHAFRSIGNKFLKDEYVEMAIKEAEYLNAINEWKRYLHWKKNRNKARAVLEEKCGYDCYSDDTEFLTYDGWKKYDEIKSTERLATIFLGDYSHRKHLSLEYQKFIDRFEGKYTGDMYNLYGNHIDTLVTPNHRILYNKKERESKKRTGFILEEAATLPDTFDIIIAPRPPTKKYENRELKGLPIKQESYLRLMGWYLSDGSMNMRNRITSKAIRISQKKRGKLYWKMSRFTSDHKDKISCKLYCYKRKPNDLNKKEIEEATLIITDKTIRDKLLKDCGRLKNKRIPIYVYGLSKRLKEILMNALMGGDGTIRNTSCKSFIYYSTMKNLSDDVQRLALSCGWETSLYGPYYDSDRDYEMYQVHVNKNKEIFKECIRSKNIKKIKVNNQRIVCFTVPNGTLITRRNGHIGIHGNSKHASHLVRLLRMGEEILRTGTVNVDRTNIDAEELKEIRDGSWSYEKVEEYAYNTDKELYTTCEESKLPKQVDYDSVEELCLETIEQYHSDNNFQF